MSVKTQPAVLTESERLAAHMIAAKQVTNRLRTVLEHLAGQNFGLAKDAIVELIENGLPNDHNGPVTHYPLFEAELAKQLRRRYLDPRW